LPLALAFGVSSGLGPSAGLYGAIFLSFFAALFGGTNTQISGPTAPMTAVSMVVIAGIIAVNDGDVEKALPAILTVFLLAGVMQILPSIGYYPKEDTAFVQQFKPQAEELILENILKEEAGEGILVLEDFKETIQRAQKITQDDILKESKTLAQNQASGVIGAL